MKNEDLDYLQNFDADLIECDFDNVIESEDDDNNRTHYFDDIIL